MAHCGVNGKGDNNYKAGVTLNEYARVHRWINRKKGKANKCENPDCDFTTKKYHHALKKGCNYEKKEENFLMLCVKCHKKYDWKDEYADKQRGKIVSQETRQKLREKRIGVSVITKEGRERMSKRMSGVGNPMFGVSVKGENHHFFGKKHSEEAKFKMMKTSAKATQEQVLEIKRLFESGVKQKNISKQFGLSTASVCRITNNKRYKQWQDSAPF